MAIKFVKKGTTDYIIDKLSRIVTHTPQTKVIDFNGEETFTASTAVTINAAVLRRNKSWKFDKAGRIEGGDAYIIIKADEATLSENDKINFDSITYRVKENIIRYSDSDNETAIYQYANLFVLE